MCLSQSRVQMTVGGCGQCSHVRVSRAVLCGDGTVEAPDRGGQGSDGLPPHSAASRDFRGHASTHSELNAAVSAKRCSAVQ